MVSFLGGSFISTDLGDMAMESGSRSTLNPDAPLFIPAALQQVEDFSPEWWDLVHTSTWFREYWFQQHQELESFEEFGEVDDIANLLPDSIDSSMSDGVSLAIDIGMSDGVFPTDVKRGFQMNAEALMKNLNPKEGARPLAEPGRHWEKPVQCVSPKNNVRRIQQPR